MSQTFKTWRRTSEPAKNICELFRKHQQTGGKEGISINATAEQIKSLYDSTPELAAYNPRYFTANFKSLGTWFTTQEALQGARSKSFYSLFYL